VPEDVIVTGFDGLAAGLISQPTLTTVRQPMHDLGIAAVELLLNRIADPESPAEHRRFPVELTIRASCGCSAQHLPSPRAAPARKRAGRPAAPAPGA
jgi:LacI family transcriptional regulator